MQTKTAGEHDPASDFPPSELGAGSHSPIEDEADVRDALLVVAIGSLAAFGCLLLALAGLAAAEAMDLIRSKETAAEGDDSFFEARELELARLRHPSSKH